MKYCIAFILFFLLTKTSHAQTAEATVYFAFNESVLTDKAKNSIDSLLQLVNKQKVQSVKITAHCDQIGSDAYNQQLSLKRADAVKTYINPKISLDSIHTSITGKGKTDLVTTLTDEDSRQLNRRATVFIEYTPVVMPTTETTEKTVSKPSNKLIEAITDTAFKTGQTLVLRNILFYGGEHVILPESVSALYELLETMNALPNLKIEIRGHICCGGKTGSAYDGYDGYDNSTRTFNLSHNRAKTVFEFLVIKGIDASRMQFKGYGYQLPLISPEKNESDRTLNRRVEIKVLEK